MLPINIYNKLEKLGLINKTTLKLDVTYENFVAYLSNLIGPQEIKMFGKPKFPYWGWTKNNIFEITENLKYFSNDSDAKLSGKITDYKNYIEIRIESTLLGTREYIFFIIGVLMLCLGCFRVIFNVNTNTENLTMIGIGIFALCFTFLYIKSSSKNGLNNFILKMDELKKNNLIGSL